jgi:tRNA threonylcarbamoyladenosine biosynthesis protein TsaE
MTAERFTALRTTRSARATLALGKRLGALLQPGDVVALVGELGAGKTQLVRGVCEGAAVPAEEVSSPSFAIVATYHGRIPVHHADLYRIADEDELYATGLGDLVGGDGALLVEWADRIPSALPAERLTLTLSHDAKAPSVRHVEIDGVGARHAALAEALASPEARRAATKGRSEARPTTGGVRKRPQAAKRHEFEVMLRGGRKGELAGWIEVPFDVEEVFGTRGRVPVKVTVNGLTYRSSMSPMGGCHVIPVRRDRAEAAEVRAGDRVSVAVERDTAARVVKPPPELARALAKNKAAKTAWDRCSYTHKREYAESIREAKKDETRARRVERAIAMLASGKSRK